MLQKLCKFYKKNCSFFVKISVFVCDVIKNFGEIKTFTLTNTFVNFTKKNCSFFVKNLNFLSVMSSKIVVSEIKNLYTHKYFCKFYKKIVMCLYIAVIKFFVLCYIFKLEVF